MDPPAKTDGDGTAAIVNMCDERARKQSSSNLNFRPDETAGARRTRARARRRKKFRAGELEKLNTRARVHTRGFFWAMAIFFFFFVFSPYTYRPRFAHICVFAYCRAITIRRVCGALGKIGFGPGSRTVVRVATSRAVETI